MKKCFIIDDEQRAIHLIENCIKQVSTLQMTRFSSNAQQAIEMIYRNEPDLIFLDKCIDETNPHELMDYLNKPIKIIVCHCFTELETHSFDLDAIDYHMKSISLPRFIDITQQNKHHYSALSFISKEREIPSDYIFLKTESKGKMIKLDLADINYIQGMNNNVAFHTANKVIVSHFTLRQLEDLLPRNSFIRVHKSYIVPIKKIVAVAKQELKLSATENSIPLSPNFRAAFLERVHVN